MKKLLVIFAALMIIFSSCTNGNSINNEANVDVKPVEKPQEPASPPPQESKLNTPRAVGLSYDKSLGDKIDGINTIVLDIDGLRIAKKPYRTDNVIAKNVDRVIGELEKKETNYYLSIKSGPGLTRDGNISTLFTKRSEALYFAQMVREMALRYKNHKHLKGIMLDIGSSEVTPEDYYDTLAYILNRVQSEVPEANFIVSLHPLSFEDGFTSPDEYGIKDVTFNLDLYFKSITYPGYAQGYRDSYEIDKNLILKRLQPYMEWASKNNSKLFVSVESPWVEKTEVLLQDIFELLKMLKLDYIINSGNSEDIYDLRNSDAVLKVIKRQSN